MYKDRTVYIRRPNSNNEPEIVETYIRWKDIRDVISALQESKEKWCNAWDVIGIMEPQEELFIKDYH